MDDAAIATALAARATAVNAPSGYAAIRTAHAFPTDSLGATPAVVVFSGTDQIEYGGQTRRTVLTHAVRVYLDTIADIKRRSLALAAYRAWGRNLYNGTVTLGGLVDMTSVTSTTIGTETLGGVDYMVVELTVETTKQEALNFTA
jgi:hypothetical protein